MSAQIGWLRRQQRDPDALIDSPAEHVDAVRIRHVVDEHRSRRIARRQRGQVVERLQTLQQRHRGGTLFGGERGLDVGLRRDRQNVELGERFERNLTGHRCARRQRHGGSLRRVGKYREHSVRSGGRLQWQPEQFEERQPLPFGNQVGPVQNRIGQPCEQFDQRAAWISGLLDRPFRRVGRNARQHVLHQVVVGAIVKCWWYQGHRVTRLASSRRFAAARWCAATGSKSGRGFATTRRPPVSTSTVSTAMRAS